MQEDDDALELVGLSVATATERVVERENCDRETIREILATVSEDGTITQEAVDDALADLSKVVATPETRIEVARRALPDARDAAAPIAHADAVRSRLNDFETQLSLLDERVDALGSRLSSLVERAQNPDDLYALARAIREVRSGATDVQRDADSLAVEIEGFERNLRNPSEWAKKLSEDVDAAEHSITELLEVANNLSEIDAEGDSEVEPPRAWADATLQQRMQPLVLADIRTELDALKQIQAVEGMDDVCKDIESRLTELEALCDEVGHILDDASEPAWEQDYGETIESFTRTVEECEVPINWAQVQEKLQRHRNRITNTE